MATAAQGHEIKISVLSEVVLAIAVKLEGRTKAVLLAEILGIHESLARKQGGAPRRAKRRAEAERHGERWLAQRLMATGLGSDDAVAMIASCPTGVLEGLLYWMFHGDSLHDSTLTTVRELDAIDSRISQLVNARDADAMLDWLRVEALERPRLFTAVDAAGCPAPPTEGMERDAELRARLNILLVNMLLSFLSVLDWETRPRIATDLWIGRSLLSTLIAPPTESPRAAVRSPIALFVDLVLATGWTSIKGELPDRRPTPLAIARMLAGRGRGSASLDRMIHSLRREHTKLDREALLQLLPCIKQKSAGPNQTVDDEALMLLPVLVAAHLLSEMMPRQPRSPHHDRRGWREAYLAAWRFHGAARGEPIEPTGDPGPPDWLTFA